MVDPRFLQAAQLLPPLLREEAVGCPLQMQMEAEELRLRTGRALTVTVRGQERGVSARQVDEQMLWSVLESAAEASIHTVSEALRSGYCTARGGFRVGICGTPVLRDGCPDGFRSLQSVCIRISREKHGIADRLLRAVGGAERMPSLLLLSPPGGGKTTLLRELVRSLSRAGQRISLCDERGEIAALWHGVPQLDVGPCTDVMDSCPKEPALRMLLRAMAPQILAMDEITDPNDTAVLLEAAGRGVRLLATAHGRDPSELRRKPAYIRLLREGAIGAFAVLSLHGGERKCELVPAEEAVF